MFSRRAAVAGLLLSLVTFYAPASAAVTTIALTDGDASGISGGKFGVLSVGSVNEVGGIVFSAQLQQGFGGVDPNNDTGIWLFDGLNTTLLAREGAGNVPDVAGGSFSVFHAWSIDDTGGVGLRATLAEGPGGVTGSNKEGIWRYTGGVGSVGYCPKTVLLVGFSYFSAINAPCIEQAEHTWQQHECPLLPETEVNE